MKQTIEDKTELEETVLLNVKELIAPFLEEFRVIAKKQNPLHRQTSALHISPQVPAAFVFFVPLRKHKFVRLVTQFI